MEGAAKLELEAVAVAQCCKRALRDKGLHTALDWIDRRSMMAQGEDSAAEVDESLIDKRAHRRVDLGDLTGAA